MTILVRGLSLTGLFYLGTKLPNNLETVLKDNSLIFHLHGGYFTPPCCCVDPPELRRFVRLSVQATDVRDSYTVNKLCSLRSKMQALRQQSESAKALRERIAHGYESQIRVVYPRSTLNRLLQPKQASREKKAESLRVRKELEVARFRTKLLDQERIRKVGEIRALNQAHADIVEENQDHGDYSLLINRMEILFEPFFNSLSRYCRFRPNGKVQRAQQGHRATSRVAAESDGDEGSLRPHDDAARPSENAAYIRAQLDLSRIASTKTPTY